MDDSLKLLSVFLNLPLVAMVMARIGGLVMFAPFFSSTSFPMKARVFLAAGITLIIVPFVADNVAVPETLGGLVAAVFAEMLIGLVFGFGLLVLFAALEFAGLMIGQQMGLALARVFDPLAGDQTSVLGQLYFWLAMVIFLVIDGHHVLLAAIIKSFSTLPAGSLIVTSEALSVLSDILQTAFVVALKVSAPIIVTMFLTTLSLGFVARTVPQLNILSVGFPLRSILGFVLTIVCLGAAIDVFIGVFDDVFDQLQMLLGA